MRRGGKNGDGEADELAEWLSLGYATAYRTAYGLLRNRTDAEDAVQEAFLRAWRFRAAVPSGEGVQPWLYRVVVNACLSKLRRDGRYRATVVSMGDDGTTTDRPGPAQAESDPEGRAVDGAAHELVLDALAGLPEHLRVVVVLRYYGALSEREIATVIHRRPGTVKSRMHEARTRLSADRRLVDLAGMNDDAGVAPTVPEALGSERR